MHGVRIGAVVVLISVASLVLASPASADPVDGTYRVAAKELSGGGFEWTFSSCGPDCLNVDQGARGQLHRQGASWTGTTNAGCATVINESSLAGTYQCPMLPPIAVQLTKVG